MIKVGDKFTYKEHEWTVIDLDNFQDTLEAKDEDGNERYFMQSKAYKNWYEQQKQRADELEKRWSKLVDVLNKKYEYYKVRADDESAGPIEQGKWKIAKHELMMVLKIMTDLKRGETE